MQSTFTNPEFISLLGLLLVSGAFAGLLAGLFGVGGGIILVPALLYAFDELGYSNDVTAHMAVGTSLAIIVPTSITSAWSHYKRGSGNIILLRKLAFPVVSGALLGSWLGGSLSGDSLKTVFATLTMLIALNLLQKNNFVLGKKLPALSKQWSAGGLIGLISAIMGIGGGVFFTSYFIAYSLPMLSAVGTSASLGLMISLPGAIGYIISGWYNPNLPQLSFGYLNLLSFVFIFPITMFMAPQGAKLAHRLDKDKLKCWFALFLMIMSLRMFYKVFI
jgi:uncharacterized membrane protein YfcA